MRALRTLHSSARVLKREERRVDTRIRVHLFDFDALEERNKLPQNVSVLPEDQLAALSPSGFRPPAPSGPMPGLKFCVHRSSSGGELPVYSEFKNKKARASVVIRRVSGDLNELEQHVRKVVGEGPVIKRRVASLEVFGRHEDVIRESLLRLGF